MNAATSERQDAAEERMPGASVIPRLPEGLAPAARADILEAQAVMRRLVAMIPAGFAYADDIGLVPRCGPEE